MAARPISVQTSSRIQSASSSTARLTKGTQGSSKRSNSQSKKKKI